MHEAGYLSASDVHILNWILVGCCESLQTGKGKKGNGDIYASMWEALNQPYTLVMMMHHPIQNYCCQVFDESGSNVCQQADAECLVRPQQIRHTVMIAVTTD